MHCALLHVWVHMCGNVLACVCTYKRRSESDGQESSLITLPTFCIQAGSLSQALSSLTRLASLARVLWKPPLLSSEAAIIGLCDFREI